VRFERSRPEPGVGAPEQSPWEGLALAVGARGRARGARLTEHAVLARLEDGAAGPLPAHGALLRSQLEDHPIHGFQVQAQLTLQGVQLGERDGAQVGTALQPPALQLFPEPPELGLHLLLLLQRGAGPRQAAAGRGQEEDQAVGGVLAAGAAGL